jgi:hypothetical protein
VKLAGLVSNRRPPTLREIFLSDKPLPSLHDISWQTLLSHPSPALTSSAVREVKTLPTPHPVTYVHPRPGVRDGAVARCTTVRRTAGRSLGCVRRTPSPFHILWSSSLLAPSCVHSWPAPKHSCRGMHYILTWPVYSGD